MRIMPPLKGNISTMATINNGFYANFDDDIVKRKVFGVKAIVIDYHLSFSQLGEDIKKVKNPERVAQSQGVMEFGRLKIYSGTSILAEACGD